MTNLTNVVKKIRSGTKLAESSKAGVDESKRKLTYIEEIIIKKKNIEKNEKVNILYIVVSENLRCRIFINDRKSPWVKLSLDYKQVIERFKKEFTEFTGSEEAIESFGADFYKVLPYKVRKEFEDKKIDWVWIDCSQEEINPFWEWIYTGDGEPLFWGDKYSIVRIQEGCDMSDCQISNEVIILADYRNDDSRDYVPLLKKVLDDARVKYKVIKSPNNKLDISSDCIIYAAGSTKETYDEYKVQLEEILLLEKRILFLNLYPSSQLRLNELPATWLDSKFAEFNIPKEFTLSFVKHFFEVLNELLEKGEEREVRVAEIVRKTRNKCDSLWRLAYIVNGNPYIKLAVGH